MYLGLYIIYIIYNIYNIPEQMHCEGSKVSPRAKI